jgi:RNA polymerase sigma factor (TIGR02999 family)
MRRERSDHTLQATALIDDAFMRLAGTDGKAIRWQDRAHFYRAAARAMRRILIDHERQRKRQKRGGGQYRRADVDLDELGQDQFRFDLLAMDEALDSLATFDPRQADVVELRHFGGYTVEETASILEISPTTVKDEFATAKLWLLREISRGDEDR